MMTQVWNTLPDGVKRWVRKSEYMTRRKAARLASSSKRLDICASQMASCFHLARHPSIEDKICLEIGAGWVLTHSLVCYLLGAKKVIATDLTACARPEVLSIAVNQAIESIVRDMLAPFTDYTAIRRRLNRLKRINSFDFDTLSELGISYVSPLDLANDSLTSEVDFIFSNSVLEHVPVQDSEKLLWNLNDCLNPAGSMIHCIHLEDHKDSRTAPFDFLKIPRSEYTKIHQGERGNRIRVGQWTKMFESLENSSTSTIYSHSRVDLALPRTIDSSICYESQNELRVSHVGFYTQKRG